MIPSEFPESNTVLTAPEGHEDVVDLPVWKGDGHVVSLWRPNWRERLSLLLFGRLWLHFVLAHTHPPVGVTARRSIFSS